MTVGSAAERGVQWLIAEPNERESKHCRVYWSCSVTKITQCWGRRLLGNAATPGMPFPLPVNTVSGIMSVAEPHLHLLDSIATRVKQLALVVPLGDQ